MAEAPRPQTTPALEHPPVKQGGPESPAKNQLSLEDTNKSLVPAGSKENAGAMTVLDSPTKEKGMNDSRSAPNSPNTPEQTLAKISPGKRGSNLKAEAFAVAHSKRVEHEAHAYIDAEVRKAEAHAEKLKALAEKEKIREAARAVEMLKKEEQRAETVVHEAVLKAEKLVAQATEKANIIKANAKEASEKHIADSTTKCESDKASAEEQKGKKMAEIKDQAEIMLASGELIPSEHKGVSQRIKEHLICFAH